MTGNKVISRMTETGGKVMSAITGLLAALLILYSGYVLYDSLYMQSQAFSSPREILDLRPEIIEDGSMPLAGGDSLAALNKDYRAWLTIYDTHIDYPVMQGENDLYYASHDVSGNSSLTGAIYLATGNSANFTDNYNLLYGHHMDNGAMFGGLDYYLEEAYFDGHREGVLVTSDAVYDLEIFAAVETDAYDSLIYTPGNQDLGTLMEHIRQNAIRFDETVASGTTQIVAFSTCASAETNGRLVVLARMTLRGSGPVEDPDPVTPPTAPPTAPPATVVTPAPAAPTTTENPAETTEQTEDQPASDPAETSPAEPAEPNQETVPEEIIPETIEDEQTPLAAFTAQFQPTGGTHGTRAWALVNLICLILTVYLFLPLLHLKAKYTRIRLMKKANKMETALPQSEEKELYAWKKFRRRMYIGLILELLVSILAIIVFILTEDMRLPMVLIDKWTLLAIIFLLICWVVDVRLIRYRNKKEAENEETAANAAVS